MAFAELQLDIFSHNVKVTKLSPHVRPLIYKFARTLAEDELVRVAHNRYERKIKRTFATTTADRLEFRFHINVLDDLLKTLEMNGIGLDKINVIRHDIPAAEKVKFKFIDKRVPREEDQVPNIAFLSTNERIKTLPTQTGSGKTLMTNHAINNMSERTLLIVKGMYVQRWIDDLAVTFKLDKGDLIVIRGSKDLKTVIELALLNQLDAKFLIITNTTLRNFFEEYEESPYGNSYACKPEELMSVLKIGVRVIDEAHQDFHLNFKIDLYTHVRTCINLSATLMSDNQFLNKMYGVAYPYHCRPPAQPYDKYIAVKAYLYSLRDARNVRFKQRGRGSYSHVVFEEFIMKSQKLFTAYVDMLADITKNDFIQHFEYGQRFIVFCSTIEFCTKVTQEFKKRFPNVLVGRYVGEDDADVLRENDIIVSTLQSAGTAVDIPGLWKVLLSTAIGSRQANEQACGRLRRLRQWPDLTPEFIYLVCEDIENHIKYHNHKREVLEDKILSFKVYNTSYKI